MLRAIYSITNKHKKLKDDLITQINNFFISHQLNIHCLISILPERICKLVADQKLEYPNYLTELNSILDNRFTNAKFISWILCSVAQDHIDSNFNLKSYLIDQFINKEVKSTYFIHEYFGYLLKAIYYIDSNSAKNKNLKNNLINGLSDFFRVVDIDNRNSFFRDAILVNLRDNFYSKSSLPINYVWWVFYTFVPTFTKKSQQILTLPYDKDTTLGNLPKELIYHHVLNNFILLYLNDKELTLYPSDADNQNVNVDMDKECILQ
ncbi:MAG: hypothetical protein ACK5WP_03360 [Neisseriaceae bacterium]